MDRNQAYTSILIDELKPALGCTEPIAIALASAAARKELGTMPESILISCSGNIVKNVKGVTVPNSGGMKGIETAAVIGTVAGNPDAALEVISSVSPEQLDEARRLLAEGITRTELAEGVPGLYISATLKKGSDEVTAKIVDCHNEISSLIHNGRTVFSRTGNAKGTQDADERKDLLSVEGIIEYASEIPIGSIEPVLSRQWELNEAIAEEGLADGYGVSVGRTLLEHYDGKDVRIRARAKAAAGSDARMSGCPLPVVINSGSGNQGLTVSLPVIEFGNEMGKSREEILRALAVSNLIAIHQKQFIGPLSAYCGAVSAAAGAAAGIAFLMTSDPKVISGAITNTLASVGGIVCDGAKSSCAAKISSSLEAAIFGLELALDEDKAFEGGDGLVKNDIEKTIETFGKVGKEGMKETDIEILHLMLEE